MYDGSFGASSGDSSDDAEKLSARVITSILVVTAVLPLVAACIAIRFRFGTTNNRGLGLECEGNASDFVGLASNIRQREEEECATGVTMSDSSAELEKYTMKEKRSHPTETHPTPETCKAHNPPSMIHIPPLHDPTTAHRPSPPPVCIRDI